MTAADWVTIIKWIIVGVLLIGMIVLLGLDKLNVEGALGLAAGIVAIVFGGSQLTKKLNK